MHVLFAHGLWSSPQSSKATWMRQTLGWSVDAIDLHRFGWSARAQMEAVMDAVTTDSSYDALIGSSFGGLAVANAASRLRDHPLHLVLLAPAFGHPDLIRADLGPEVMAMWERTGYHRFEPIGWEAPIDLPWSFMAEGADLDWPDLVHPTGILHGRQDAVVPHQNSERAVAGSEVATLTLVEDDHRLASSLDHLPIVLGHVKSNVSNTPGA